MNIKKIVAKIMRRLKRQKFLKRLSPIQQNTLEEDLYELLEEWNKVTKEE